MLWGGVTQTVEVKKAKNEPNGKKGENQKPEKSFQDHLSN